jgi:hypothetical protein
MIRRRLLTQGLATAAVLLFAFSFSGCNGNPMASPLERVTKQLINARTDRTILMDDLYGEYGGGSLAQGVNAEIDKADVEQSSGGLASFIKGVVSETDRSLFEVDVRIVGSGERTLSLSAKAKAFFADEGVKKRCIKFVMLETKVESLEAELATIKAGQ